MLKESNMDRISVELSSSCAVSSKINLFSFKHETILFRISRSWAAFYDWRKWQNDEKFIQQNNIAIVRCFSTHDYPRHCPHHHQQAVVEPCRQSLPSVAPSAYLLSKLTLPHHAPGTQTNLLVTHGPFRVDWTKCFPAWHGLKKILNRWDQLGFEPIGSCAFGCVAFQEKYNCGGFQSTGCWH